MQSPAPQVENRAGLNSIGVILDALVIGWGDDAGRFIE